ncbi:hypothetical protein XENOCAPTIV_014889, partial [Xenoophorus captivus]
CVVSQQEVESFIGRCITTVGAKPHHASSLAEVLVTADCRGHCSHGLNRMDMYLKDIQTGVCAVEEYFWNCWILFDASPEREHDRYVIY